MKCSLFVTLSFAVASFAASIFPPAGSKVISAASYKAAAIGTLGADRRDTLTKRDAGNVYLCTAANFEQYCVYITDAGPGECVNLAGDLNDLVSSFGPDPNQYCYVYRNANCDRNSDQVGPIQAPGIADLSQHINLGEGGIIKEFNDVISSYA
ncbi:hypothetical protein B0H19DRAFT_1270461 [Mycena capillaripes]|nr:hypothetical protein B0H19DRAFT_1270461 [Mycena capillaripes]